MDSRLWTVQQVAEFLGVAPCWVYERTRKNDGLPFVRLGARHIRFDPAVVREWVRQQYPQPPR